jgi:cysteine-rich repeat protein
MMAAIMRSTRWMWVVPVAAGLAIGACFDGAFMLHLACRSDADCVSLACVEGYCGGPPADAGTTDTTPTGPDPTGDTTQADSSTTGPGLPCGDGVLGPDEQCDGPVDDPATRCVACEIVTCPPGYHLVDVAFCDEVAIDPDTCLATCVPDTCGDGLLNTYEECDDGNTDNNDGCLVTCMTAECGDGVVHTGAELCDDGNKSNGDDCDQRCTVPTCGDGVVDDGEECDDNNFADDDACRNVCLDARCGDAIVQAGEMCDDGLDPGDDSCDDACMTPSCGDGVIQSGEVCDDGNQDDTDDCVGACVEATCGDEFIHTGVELCDDGDDNGNGPCDADCVLVSCGDDVVQMGEQCDDGDGDNTDDCLDNCIDAFCGDTFVHDVKELCDFGKFNAAIGCVDGCTQLTPIVGLAAGPFTTCALIDGGGLRCWGRNTQCQLGIGSSASVGDDELPLFAPDVALPGPLVQVVLGREHTCALLTDRSVRCWGSGGLLGYADGDARGCEPATVPAQLPPVVIWDGDENTLALAAGELHTCALSNKGRVRCWGLGLTGDLGLPGVSLVGLTDRPIDVPPVDIGGLATALRASNHTTCVILASGALRCWGGNFWGSLGYGTYETIGDDETPASAGDIQLDGPVVDVAVGSSHTCARLTDDRLRCWGSNLSGELGLGDFNFLGYATPQPVTLGGPVADLQLGASLTCARMMTGDVRCWGSGAEGQLANGTGESFGLTQPAESAAAVAFANMTPAYHLTASNGHACARLQYGEMYCWGLDGDGQLGYGQTANLGDNPDEVPLYRPIAVFTP